MDGVLRSLDAMLQQQFGRVGSLLENDAQLGALGGREILQHVGGRIFASRWASHSDANSLKVFGAQRRCHRSQTIVAALAATELQPDAPEVDVQLVVDHHHVSGGHRIEFRQRPNVPAGFVHEVRGLASTTDRPPSRPVVTSAPDFLCSLEPCADPIGQDVGNQKPKVVPRGFVARPRVAQADHQKRFGQSELLRLGSSLFGCLSLDLSRSLSALGAGALGIEVLGGRRGDDVDHQGLGVGHQRDALGELDLAGQDLGAGRNALDGQAGDLGIDWTSASIWMVLASWVTRVPDSASPSTTTFTSSSHLLAPRARRSGRRADCGRIGCTTTDLVSASCSLPAMSRVRTALVPELRSTAANLPGADLQVLRVGAVAVQHDGHLALATGQARGAPAGLGADRSVRLLVLEAAPWPCELLLMPCLSSVARPGLSTSVLNFPSITVVRTGPTLAVIVANTSRNAPYSGNSVPVNWADSSHSAVAVRAERPAGLISWVGPVGPRMANSGPTKVLPGRS